MKWVKEIYFNSLNIIPFLFIERLSSIDLALPYHHVVSDEYLPHIKGLYGYKNESQFIKDLDWILKFRKPLDPYHLARYLSGGEKLPEKSFLLTFDDGFKEIYNVIAPILLKKGVPAIFFVNPSFVDNKELFYRCKLSLVIERLKQSKTERLTVKKSLGSKTIEMAELREKILSINYLKKDKADVLGRLLEIDFDEYLKSEKPFVTSEQLQNLKESGFTIGAHSIDHPHFKLLAKEEQLKQTISSLDATGKFKQTADYSFFSFPHEDREITQSYFDSIGKMTQNSPVLFFGVQNQKTEKKNNVLHRFNAENPDVSLKKRIKGVLFHEFLLRTLGKNEVVRNY